MKEHGWQLRPWSGMKTGCLQEQPHFHCILRGTGFEGSWPGIGFKVTLPKSPTKRGNVTQAEGVNTRRPGIMSSQRGAHCLFGGVGRQISEEYAKAQREKKHLPCRGTSSRVTAVQLRDAVSWS